jgi:hypothetical protein
MRGRTIVAAAMLGSLGAASAEACSPRLGSFREQMSQAPLAVQGKIRVQWSERSMDHLAGTAVLDVRQCLKRPKSLPRCPRRLKIRFDEALDGINCPPDISAALFRQRRLNFFLLWADGGGSWDIGLMTRQFDR